jgi:hypothetical protein
MPEKTRSNVSRLLRVLVAGGMALAGVHGARAQEKPPPPAEKSDGEKDKGSEKAKADEQQRADEQKKAEEKKNAEAKKKGEEKKPAEPDGGGVKGW